MGDGACGLGPIPNPQSPIPNPHVNLIRIKLININLKYSKYLFPKKLIL